MRNLIQQCYCLGGKHPLDDEKFYELIVKSCNKKLDIQDFKDVLKDMLSMTNENGFVIFDIMEIGSLYYLKMSWDLIKLKSMVTV